MTQIEQSKKLNIYNKAGQVVGEMEPNLDVFGYEASETLLHFAVLKHLANRRLGCASTKTRGEVRGGGRKPWKQKGTGRARHGSRRSPIWKGGGITFGPKPRDYSISMPKKRRRLALKHALSAKLEAERMFVVDSLNMEEISTKKFLGMMKDLKLTGRSLFVMQVAEKPQIIDYFEEDSYEKVTEEYLKSLEAFNKVRKSGRNIEGVKIVQNQSVSVYDLLYYDNVVFDKAAVEYIEEVLS